VSTEKLYLRSLKAGYETTFSAEVIETTESEVILDQTLFYPLGGGQNWDTGKLSSDTGTLQVSEVKGRDKILHKVGSDHGLNPGDLIQGEIDWERRYAHMRMHTAQHLLSGIVYESFNGARTVGNQIHADRSRIDFQPIKFDDEMIELAFNLAQEAIESDLEVTETVMTREQINAIMPPERTNMDLLPSSVRELRIIKIGNNRDLCPCAGTHVQSLGEIGKLHFLSKKSKGKGKQRIQYTLK
jgi:misacylated tRNA(Ala) deacylase